MTIAHETITDPYLHEPKGIASAVNKAIYVADGAGGGAWSLLYGNNFAVINDEDDFPAQSGGIITLEDNTTYVLTSSVSTAYKFTLGINNAFVSFNPFKTSLTYTGTGVLFTGTDVSFSTSGIGIVATLGTIFDMTDTVGGVKYISLSRTVIAGAAKLGSIDDMLGIGMSQTSIVADAGIDFTGSNIQVLSIDQTRLVSTSGTFVGIDLGTAILDDVNINAFTVVAPSGAIGIRGASASGNIPTGKIANVTNSSFTGGTTTPLSGISADDIRWKFDGNSANVPDTMPDSLLSLVLNATATTLSVGVPTIVAGTWVDERSSQFTNTSGGRGTYNGERDLTTPIDISITVDVASGTNKSIRAYVAINGTVVTNSGKAVNISSGDPKELTLHWQAALSTSDYVEVFIENETDSVNATAIDGTIRIR